MLIYISKECRKIIWRPRLEQLSPNCSTSPKCIPKLAQTVLNSMHTFWNTPAKPLVDVRVWKF